MLRSGGISTLPSHKSQVGGWHGGSKYPTPSTVRRETYSSDRCVERCSGGQHCGAQYRRAGGRGGMSHRYAPHLKHDHACHREGEWSGNCEGGFSTCHPFHVFHHPLPESWLHCGQRRLHADLGHLPPLVHPPGLHRAFHLCPCHQWSGEGRWGLLHALEDHGT